MAEWINHSAGTGSRNGTADHTIDFTTDGTAPFTPSDGSLLVLVAAGGVTMTTPTGWSVVRAQVSASAIYVWAKVVAGDTSVTTTHNGSDYPIEWTVYEFYDGSSLTGTPTGSNGEANTVFAVVNDLPGTAVTVIGCANKAKGSGAGAQSCAWDSPWIEDVDRDTAFVTTDGAYLSTCHQDGVTTSTATPAGTITGSGTGNRITFAVDPVSPPTPTVPTVDAGSDVPGHTVDTAFNRTATENANLSTITARAWKIVSGPTGAGTTIGTSAALSWTPTVNGTYVLSYEATNGIGTSTPDTMQIVVADAPPPPVEPYDHINSGIAARNGTSIHTIDFAVDGDDPFTPTTGRLLLFLVHGPVTHSATGWTKQASEVSSGELAAFTKTAQPGAATITLTHNGADYPITWVVYEMPARAAFVSANGSSPNTDTFDELADLPGSDVAVFAARARVTLVDGSAASTTWNEDWTEDVDLYEPPVATSGTYLTTAHQNPVTATSVTAAGTTSYTGGAANDRQHLTLAVDLTGVPQQTWTGFGNSFFAGLVASRSPLIVAPAVVTHGSEIALGNTGWQAYFDPVLGRTLAASDLTRVTGVHFVSDFTGGVGGTEESPKIVEKLDVDEILFDVDWVTVRACKIRNPATSFYIGVHRVGARLEWCTLNPATVGSECMRFQSWSALRCQFRGCSDGAKINGGVEPITIDECYIGVKMASADDHNDCVQNVGGSGSVAITKSKLTVDPEGGRITGGSGGPNACIMSADMSSGSLFSLTATDCYFDGGTSAYAVRLYDGGLTPNITYSVTGCLWKRTTANPVHRGSANVTPLNQITWSNNRWADDLSTISLT